MTSILKAAMQIFLSKFIPEAKVGIVEFMSIKTELEKLLERNVYLLEPEAIVNPYVLASIERNRETVYAVCPASLSLGRKRITLSY